MSMIVACTALADDIALSGGEVSLDIMNESRGGQNVELDLVYAESDINGISSDNVASNTVSGKQYTIKWSVRRQFGYIQT
nr:hypothetical protein [Vibrio parahaemolyticus]